jgi:hypothetical protein
MEVILLGEVLARVGRCGSGRLMVAGTRRRCSRRRAASFYVKGLENGDYEAVDELGNSRVFTVSEGPGEEIVLEDVRDADAPAGQELPPNYGTEADLGG